MDFAAKAVDRQVPAMTAEEPPVAQPGHRKRTQRAANVEKS